MYNIENLFSNEKCKHKHNRPLTLGTYVKNKKNRSSLAISLLKNIILNYGAHFWKEGAYGLINAVETNTFTHSAALKMNVTPTMSNVSRGEGEGWGIKF